MPAPVIVMKDVGGLVADYQSQTAIYRASEREVRLHECRSACTMAQGISSPLTIIWREGRASYVGIA
ncbi:MAG: hypothetical protein WBF43_12350 [Methylocella sp.]